MSEINTVKVIEMNQGEKIPFVQEGTRLYFGDDELMVNVAKYQKDWPVVVDVCKDKAGNLTIGTGSALRYVAQIKIPAAAYSVEISGEGDEATDSRKALPLDMGAVELALWSIE